MTQEKLKQLLDATLHLNGITADWTDTTPLLGALPELDSLAVTQVLTAIEEAFGFSIYDDEVNADIFATLGSLSTFIDQKLAAA